MAGAATFGPEINNGWYEGTTESTYPKDSDGEVSWRTSLRLIDGSIYWKGDNLLNLNKNFIAVMEDCDTDCQKLGSGLSVVAAINQVALGYIMLNMVCMFIGTWRWRARVFSTYCTYVSAAIQFIILLVSGSMLFTPYASMCARSMTKTKGPFISWSMADDYQSIVAIWSIQFIWMFIFVCVGMCQQYRGKYDI